MEASSPTVIDFERVAKILKFLGISENIDAGENQPNTVLKQKIKDYNATLLGNSSTAGAEISQWLSFSRCVTHATSSKQELHRLLSTLNSMLAYKSFLVGNSFTLADVAVLEAILGLKLSKYPEVVRWTLHVLMFCPGASSPTTVSSQTPSPVVFPIIRTAAVTTAAPVASGKSTTTVAAPGEGGAEETKTAPRVASTDKKATKGKKEKAAPSAPAAVAETANDDADPSKLDFRVGYVVKCWEHPDAEKLLCEEIDIGESSGCRNIASGLRAFYRADEVQGRKVIVLANLKDRNLVGFKSQGMVICASNADHSVVKLLEPPAGANVGDRVVFDGFEGHEPASASQVAKKKILEKLSPNFKTNANGEAMWSNVAFKIGGDVCKADVPNGTVG